MGGGRAGLSGSEKARPFRVDLHILLEDPWISDTLGWIFYRKGLYPTAIRLLREAVEQAPQNPTIHYHLGLAYRKHGEANSAKGELREALRLNLEAIHAGEARRLLGEMEP